MTTVLDLTPEEATKLLVVDEDWLDRSYKSMEGFTVELDPNPIEFGPGRIVEKIHQLRNFQNRVRDMDLQASRDLSRVRRLKSHLEASYNAHRDHLLSTNLNVRVQKSAGDRVAMVNVHLPNLVQALEGLKIQEQQLVGFLAAVKTTTSNLRDTDRQINAQIRLVGQEISLGAQWMSGGMIDPKTRGVQDKIEFDMDFSAFEEALTDTPKTPKEKFVDEIDKVLAS